MNGIITEKTLVLKITYYTHKLSKIISNYGILLSENKTTNKDDAYKQNLSRIGSPESKEIKFGQYH